jgi:hypothetical protein
MPQLVTQIVLVDQDYGRGEDKVQAVVEYVNGLMRRYFYLESRSRKLGFMLNELA